LERGTGQARLADSGCALHDEQAAGAVLGPIEQRADQLELSLAFEQPSGAHNHRVEV
jgi:hypothetical protein